MEATGGGGSFNDTTTNHSSHTLLPDVYIFIGTACFIPSYLLQIIILSRLSVAGVGLSTLNSMFIMLGLLCFELVYGFYLAVESNYAFFSTFITNSFSLALSIVVFVLTYKNKYTYNTYAKFRLWTFKQSRLAVIKEEDESNKA